MNPRPRAAPRRRSWRANSNSARCRRGGFEGGCEVLRESRPVGFVSV